MKPFSRRTFIAASGAALAITQNDRARAATLRGQGGMATPVWSIVDARLGLAPAFAAEMARIGIPRTGSPQAMSALSGSERWIRR